MCVCVFDFTSLCVCVSVECLSVCVSVCTYVCVCVCVFMYVLLRLSMCHQIWSCPCTFCAGFPNFDFRASHILNLTVLLIGEKGGGGGGFWLV